MRERRLYRAGVRRPQSSPVLLQLRAPRLDFPMEHGFKDAQERAVSSRQERTIILDRLQSARTESGSMRENSRRRFQTVVDNETGPRAQPPPAGPPPPLRLPLHPPRPMTTDCSGPRPAYPVTPTTPTNGPTKDGSILYNGAPLLLNSLRGGLNGREGIARPFSEPPALKFDHLRGDSKNYPYIQRMLEQSNCEYRLRPSPHPTAREGGAGAVVMPDERERLSPDFVMLVPASQLTDVIEGANDVKRRSWKKGEAWAVEVEKEEEEGPLLASTARSRSPVSQEEVAEGEMTADLTPVPGMELSLDQERGLDNDSRSPEVSRVQQAGGVSNTPDGVPPLSLNLTLDSTASSKSPRRVPAGSPDPTDPKRMLSPQQYQQQQAKDLAGRESGPAGSPPETARSKSGAGLGKQPQQKQQQQQQQQPQQNQLPPPSSRPTSWRPRSGASDVSRVSGSSVSLTPRPHCWVDDVTVSSDESLAERDASLLPELDERASVLSEDPAKPHVGLAPGGQQFRAASPSGGDKKKVSHGIKLVPKRVPSGTKGKPQQEKPQQGGCPRSLKQSTASGSKAGGRSVALADGGGPGGEAGEEEEERELPLPRFVCPSSETKSRQVAIKEWLAKSSFSGACRTVPLM